MKAAVLLALAAAASAQFPPSQPEQRVNLTSNEFLELGCAEVILFWARGSTQDGNMGLHPGLDFANRLKGWYGNDGIHVQGLNYTADLVDNFNENGTDEESVLLMKEHLSDAADRCPQSKIVVAGFSQGAAVIHAAVQVIPVDVRIRINLAVLFGDTQRKQNNKRIQNFPRENTLNICLRGDTICEKGILEINDAHSQYETRAEEAAFFVVKKFQKKNKRFS